MTALRTYMVPTAAISTLAVRKISIRTHQVKVASGRPVVGSVSPVALVHAAMTYLTAQDYHA